MNPDTNTPKSNAALREEAILAFWKEKDIFKKSLEKDVPKGEFVFYEGPPTANAKPALHHLEARAFKDVLPRYKTMQGFHVRRRAGWDTHGLPVELQIEKKLGLKNKKEIESFGIAKFNAECKDSVFTYIKDWEIFTERMGYWVDKDDAYYTFDVPYMESLWSIFATADSKGLVYKDYKVVPWCSRCGTTLASHELAQGYQDDKDLTVTAKFKVKGVENTFILAWTTTPWTLPGNIALAVGAEITYVKIKVGDPSTGSGQETYILAKERLSIVTDQYEIVQEVKGSDLVGLEYEPLFPYFGDTIRGIEKEKMQHAYKVYGADFVTTTDGTGVVHIAPMYGADDFDLGSKVGLPKFHTVDDAGHFIRGTDFLEGRFVKDEEVAVDIIKNLAHRGLLFKKEKYEHSYPHCWRCKTPLIYYARDSWYIAMSKLRDALVAENDGINWEPAHIRDGRFGEWLKDVKDWAISRERYWGTPLPIWESADKERIVVDSLSTLKHYAQKSGNNYMIMRHGQTEHNLKGLWNYGNQDGDPLTEEGKNQVLKSAEELKKKSGEYKIDLIIASPFFRTLETAHIVAQELGIPLDTIKTDTRLSEWKVGDEYDGKPLDLFFSIRNASPDRYHFKADGAESYAEVFTRTSEFLYDIDTHYQGKNILIVSHGAVTRSLELATQGVCFDTMYTQTRDYHNFKNAEIRPISFAPLPHNDLYELDLHRPYIDEVVLEKDGKLFRRVKEVMDVWFDSGSMPFASSTKISERNLVGQGSSIDAYKNILYPADFISEAIDQTRGWFYTLHAIGVLMGRGKAYKNVICLGHLLDKEGKKMSKSIGNIVEPFSQIEKYGVDPVRYWMYSVNAPGDSKNYDEKTVDEVVKKVFNLTYNVLSFYELYRDKELEVVHSHLEQKVSVLDIWIMTRLNQLIALCTESLDSYKLFEPTRAIRDFIDDMSTWYLRRSRDRIKDEAIEINSEAKQTLYTVLKTLAQLIAPFAPFTAEDIWQKLKTDTDAESVHLSAWPKSGSVDEEIIKDMQVVREICTEGNALRKKHTIPVRQPLEKIWIVGSENLMKYEDLIKEELNIEKVFIIHQQNEDGLIEEMEGRIYVRNIDIEISDDLKKKGNYRELVRAVQDMRKAAGLEPSDNITLTISPSSMSFLTPFLAEFKKTVQAPEVIFTENDGTEIKIDDMTFKVSIER